MKKLTVAGACCIAIVISGCTANAPQESGFPQVPQRSGVQVDGPQYDSQTALREQARVVAVVEFSEVLARGTEGEFLGGDPAGLPSELWRTRVLRASKGAPSGTLLVVKPDASKVADTVPISAGEQAVLFVSPTSMKYQGATVYAPVGVDQGTVPLINGKPSPAVGSEALKATLRAWSP